MEQGKKLATEKSPPRCHKPWKVIHASSKNICVSTTPHKRQVAMAPVSSGDRVLVVSSPHKSHTHSWASIQLGQHKLKPFAADPDWGQNSTPAPLSNVVLQPCSFDSHCAGWVARSVNISIIHSYAPVMRLRGICFGEQHARILLTISSHRPLTQHQTTLFVPSADGRSDMWRHQRRKDNNSQH